ncbi:MAG TPA: hypothetical protein DCP28_33195 [Cytophagales bacterium]|nr:hypothetical protein [Cytophagales bacterium]
MRILQFSLMLLFFTGVTTPQLLGQNLRRVQRYWENQDWEALQEELIQLIAEEDFTPGEKYYYSRLYTHSGSQQYQLDSALYWIRGAQQDWAYIDDRTQGRYERYGVVDSVITNQKLWIDSAEFAQAQIEDTEIAYRQFIVQHFDALQITQATQAMYSRAYEQAEATNTYAAFAEFWNEHPDAPQVAKAKEKAQVAAYVEETSEGTLESYERFLARFPQSPFRTQAEQNILELSTPNYSASELRSFIEKFPVSQLRPKVVAMLYHVEKQAGRSTELLGSITRWPEWDSLLQCMQIEEGHLYPIWQDSAYSLWRPSLNNFIPKQFSNFPDSLCETGWPHAWLALRQTNDMYGVISRRGDWVFQGTFEQLKDLGAGLVGVKQRGQWGIWHLGKFEVLPISFEEVRRVNASFLAGEQGGEWRFFSATGRGTQMPPVREFALAGNHLLLFDGNNWTAVPERTLLVSLVHKPELNPFGWEEYELLSSGELLLFGEDSEAVMDTTGQLVVPDGPWTLEDVGFGWLAESARGYGLVLHGRRGLNPPFYQEVQSTRDWLALKNNNRWALLSPEEGFQPEYRYDSVRVLGEDVIYVEEGANRYVQLGDTTQIALMEEDRFRVLRSPNVNEAPDWCLWTTGDTLQLMNDSGKLLWKESAKGTLSRIGPHHYRWETEDGQGIGVDTAGLLLDPGYSGLGEVKEGIIPLLEDGQFGVYWLATDTVSEPQWERVPEPYSDTLLIGSIENKFGIFSASGQETIAPEYDEIRYWNDTVALCQQNYSWSLINLPNDSVLFEGMSQVTPWENGEFVIRTKEGYGLLHPTRGTLVAPELESLEWVGDLETGYWLGENYVPAAAWYVLSYFARYGRRLYRQVVDEQQIDKVYCE